MYIHWELGEFERSLELCFDNLTLLEENGMMEQAAIMTGTIGSLYQGMENYDLATQFLEKEFEYFSDTIDKEAQYFELAVNRLRFASSHLAMKEYETAIAYCNKSLAFAGKTEKLSQILRQDIYRIMYECYDGSGDSLKALKYYQLFSEIENEISGPEVIAEVHQAEDDYKTRKSDQKIGHLEGELYSADNWKILFLIISILSAIAGALVYAQKRKWKKKAHLLIEQNKNIRAAEKESKLASENNDQVKIPKTVDPITERTDEQKKKYSKSKLTDDKKDELFEQIFKLMQEEELYKESDLSIQNLANRLNSNTSYISQIINENYQTNFRNFINEFRVKEATKMLADKQYRNLTIEAIAKTTGFNSISPFNIAFKSIQGITPSYFLKSVIKVEQDGEM